MDPKDTELRQNSAAVGGFICGIIGVVASLVPFVGPFFGVAAVVLGYRGMRNARRYAVGRGSMALAALILGGITVASSAFWALVWLTI